MVCDVGLFALRRDSVVITLAILGSLSKRVTLDNYWTIFTSQLVSSLVALFGFCSLDICFHMALSTMYLAVLLDGVLRITSGTSTYTVYLIHTWEMSYVRLTRIALLRVVSPPLSKVEDGYLGKPYFMAATR